MNSTNAGNGVVMARRSLFVLEHKQQQLLSRPAFALHLAKSSGASATFIGLSLLAGMIGYHYLENLPWIDAFANAAMILSGMGPLDAPKTWDGKLFAGLYALYSGLAVILAAGILFTPVVHRMLHWFHLEERLVRLCRLLPCLLDIARLLISHHGTTVAFLFSVVPLTGSHLRTGQRRRCHARTIPLVSGGVPYRSGVRLQHSSSSPRVSTTAARLCRPATCPLTSKATDQHVIDLDGQRRSLS